MSDLGITSMKSVPTMSARALSSSPSLCWIDLHTLPSTGP